VARGSQSVEDGAHMRRDVFVQHSGLAGFGHHQDDGGECHRSDERRVRQTDDGGSTSADSQNVLESFSTQYVTLISRFLSLTVV